MKLISFFALKSILFFSFANKCGQKGAMTKKQIENWLDLDDICMNHLSQVVMVKKLEIIQPKEDERFYQQQKEVKQE